MIGKLLVVIKSPNKVKARLVCETEKEEEAFHREIGPEVLSLVRNFLKTEKSYVESENAI